jgi:hypothetical protein
MGGVGCGLKSLHPGMDRETEAWELRVGLGHRLGAPTDERAEAQRRTKKEGVEVRRGAQGLGRRTFRLWGAGEVRTLCLSWEP